VTAQAAVPPKAKPAPIVQTTDEGGGWGLSPLAIVVLAVITVGGLVAVLIGVVVILILLLR